MATSSAPIVVGIDVGTTKVCTLIAEITDDDQCEVIGVGIAPSRGLKKGAVVNTEDVIDAIGASLERAEKQSGFDIVSAYVGISGAHIQTQSSPGVVAVRHADRQITEDDVDRALEAARAISLPSDREIVHAVARNFVIDGQDGIKNPAGMIGHRIEVHTTIVSGATTSVSNLERCVQRAGIELKSLVLQPLAAGLAVLTEAERDLGVAVIDIGGGTTDVAVFMEGALTYAASIPVGGQHVTNDITVGLRAQFATAEELKVRYGCAMPEMVPEDRVVDVAAFDGGSDGTEVSLREVSEIIEPRMVELFELVQEKLALAGHRDGLPAGIVLCGGTAQLGGLRRLASDMFRTPVRIGTPTGVYGLTDQIMTPAFATSVGLLKFGLEEGVEPVSGPRVPALSGIGSALSGWLKNLLP
ncbi:MAG: cell division protein FtsA [Chloroflexi bacterium]|nr:cell division protein FtsA [Chloroflexota bacterium]